jgi:hypothetical protein
MFPLSPCMLQATMISVSLIIKCPLRNALFSFISSETQSASLGIPPIRYRGADKSSARPTSRFILFDAENIYFDASLVIYINSSNIPPIMIINRIYEHKNLLSL